MNLESSTQEKPVTEELGGLFSLTWRQRFIGFICCFLGGMLITFLSLLKMGHIKVFALLYSIGNLLAIFSTAFLIGPMQQIKNMFHPIRLTATIIYLAALVTTIIVAVKTKNKGLCVIMIVVQMVALLWYSLSYVPYARALAKKTVRAILPFESQ